MIYSTSNSNKLQRLVSTLKPYLKNSNMDQKHAAMLISGGKILSIGFNHDRMTTRKKFIMSYHAEIHSLSRFMDTINKSKYKIYLNDTEKCLSLKNRLDKYPKGVFKKET